MTIKHILTLGPGALFAKLDINNVFCLQPAHQSDWHLSAMH